MFERDLSHSQAIERHVSALDAERETTLRLRQTLDEKEQLLQEMDTQCSVAVDTISALKTAEARKDLQIKALEEDKRSYILANQQLQVRLWGEWGRVCVFCHTGRMRACTGGESLRSLIGR